MKTLQLFLLFISISVFSQKTLPKLSLPTLDSKTIQIQDLNEKDKTYVLTFWATWCAPCIQELDGINDVYEDWKNNNIEVIAVSIDDSRTVNRVKPLVNGRGWEYQVLLDTKQELKRNLSISNPPYTVVIKNGKIELEQAGHSPGAEKEFFEKLKTL